MYKGSVLILLFAISFTIVSCRNSQSASCSLCRQIFTSLIDSIGTVVSESQVDAYLRLGCTAFNLESWCQQNVYPNIHDIFLAMRGNKTDDIICERLSLCNFKVTSITGDVLFADGDVLYTIRLLPGNLVQRILFGTVSHPKLPDGIVSGLSCSVDYCAVLLSSVDSTGKRTYGTTAISPIQQIHQLLPDGVWYGPWYDVITQEFWIATGTARQYTFGIFDPQYGDWEPKVYLQLRVKQDTEILSGQILDRVLYFTILNDPHVFKIDLSVRLFRGNFTSPNNTMLVSNPVTNELYGYSPSPQGIWKYSLNPYNRTNIVNINLSSAMAVPSSTINPVVNNMWISLWGITDQDAWLIVDLTKIPGTVGWAPTGNLDGLFEFNPYTITTEES